MENISLATDPSIRKLTEVCYEPEIREMARSKVIENPRSRALVVDGNELIAEMS